MNHLRTYLVPVFGIMLMFWSGCASGGESPAPSKPVPGTDVSRIDAWMDAEKIAARDEGRVTVVGAGNSMKPIYGEGTVLVLAKIDYDALREGMQIAYMSSRGRRVVHVLLDRDKRGWRVQGLNNEIEDAERVTPYNLIGVVYASFATDSEEP
jgi:hypothetical protein